MDRRYGQKFLKKTENYGKVKHICQPRYCNHDRCVAQHSHNGTQICQDVQRNFRTKIVEYRENFPTLSFTVIWTHALMDLGLLNKPAGYLENYFKILDFNERKAVDRFTTNRTKEDLKLMEICDENGNQKIFTFWETIETEKLVLFQFPKI